MNSTHIEIDARYGDKIRVRHLAMDPDLQGKSVRFEFEGHKLEIRLPKLADDPERQSHHEYVEAEADAWNKNGDILDVYIYAIPISIHGLKCTIPIAAADHVNINTSLFTDAERLELDKFTDELHFTCHRAVEYFLQLVRWKTGLAIVGVDYRPRDASYGGRLYNLAHGGAFYSPRVGRVVKAPRRHRLTQTEWSEISATLVAKTDPPIWNEYMM